MTIWDTVLLCCYCLVIASRVLSFLPTAMQTAYLTLGQVKELDLGHKEKPDYFSFKGTVTFARKESCLYKACPGADCNKKVTEDTMGQYFCEKCNQSFTEFKYRMILMVRVLPSPLFLFSCATLSLLNTCT